jgi:probable HAF family extracellular repeat protein
MRASASTGRAAGRFLTTVVAAVAAGLVLAAPAGAATYEVIDLGTLGGASSGATDLNDAGAIVGWSRTADGHVHGVVWRAGNTIDIGTLGGPTSSAASISNNYAVVGTSAVTGGGVRHAFLWRANQGAMHNLGLPSPARIGDTGAIIGNTTNAGGEPLAAYRNQHGWIRLPLNGFDGSFGEDVNDAGTAVGTLVHEPHGSAPFVYENGVLTVLPSVPTAAETTANAINDAGLIAGQTFDPLGIVLWDGSSWQPIPTPALFIPEIRDMNDCAEIVGAHHPEQFFKPHAFLISDGAGVDLNSQIPAGSGWRLGVATAINDAGEIVGVGRHNGIQRAFLLEPTDAGAGCP